MPRREIRDGRAWCEFHATWEPVEDFDWNETRRVRNGSVSNFRSPKTNCRLAAQTLRDQGKEADPARWAIEGRAKTLAGDLSKASGQTVSYRFVLVELNWQALVPVMEALLGPRGRCLNCARHQPTARQLHIEHRCPPLHIADWPAQHARNLWLACGGCNSSKGRRDADREWLEVEHRKWMLDRDWASHAGEKGWPPYDPSFGKVVATSEPPEEPEQLTFDLT